MALDDCDRYDRIAHDAKSFGSRSHVQYLKEAMTAVRRGEAEGVADPGVDALSLLAAMWRSGYVDRPAPKRAMNDVGRWLERRLQQGASETLAEELGWMKRVATEASRGARDARDPHDREDVKRAFGDDLERLRAQRATTAAKAEVAAKKQAEAAAARPKALPEVFAATFADTFNTVRTLAKSQRDRLKKKKEPKEKLLPLAVSDPDLAPFAKGLHLSTTRTEGFLDYFDRVTAAGGGAIPFVVSSIEHTPEGPRALSIEAR